MRPLLFLGFAILISCSNDPRAKLPASGTFGKVKQNPELIFTVESLDTLKTENQEIVLEGKVNKVCQGEGCWLSLERKGKAPVLIEIKDKAFQLPRKIEGSFARINGQLTSDSSEKYSRKVIAEGITLEKK